MPVAKSTKSVPPNVTPMRPRLGEGASIHPSAIIEPGVEIGGGSSVWDNAHIRRESRIGDECIIGEKTCIAYEVEIGNRVKINTGVYICHGVTIGDGVMISAHTVFTNDRFPRATTSDLKELRSSDPDEDTLLTKVGDGATIGANCTVGGNLTIGRFAMIGMGALVTHDVPAFHLAVGAPARSIGIVCRCGIPVFRFSPDAVPVEQDGLDCECGLKYAIVDSQVVEKNPPT
ncbi:MAG: DapH/DapD/GlmU-related protein [Verrucomicrobiota bacterium]